MLRLLARRHCRLLVLLPCLALDSGVFAQSRSAAEILAVDERAVVLEGWPSVRVDTRERSSTRQALGPAESASNKLTIRIEDGRFYWENRAALTLTPIAADGFVYLMSREPGRYIRIQRINDRLTYVQHVDTGAASVTYWGELRVAIGR